MASSTSRLTGSVQVLRGVEDAAPYIRATDGNNVNPKICDAPKLIPLLFRYVVATGGARFHLFANKNAHHADGRF